MKTPKLSEREQRRLRDGAKHEVERMERYLQNENEVEIVDSFKNRFNVCESAYKIILAEHQACKNKKRTNYLKIDMRQVPQALAFAGYAFDRQLLNDLFGGARTDKGKTAKMLRNDVTHGINEKAVKEIMSRKDELFGYMDTFLNTIKSFDEIAA